MIIICSISSSLLLRPIIVVHHCDLTEIPLTCAKDETRDELGAEFHKKLDLKDEDERVAENEKKDSDFVAGSGEYGGEKLGGEGGCAPKIGEAQGSDDNDGWDDDEGYGWNKNVKESEVDKVSGDFDVDGDGNGDDEVEVEGDEEVEKKKDRSSGRVQQQYPLRPDAEDCAFYLKTGTCKFGFNCKFNHPLSRRKNQHSMGGAKSLLRLLTVCRKGSQDNHGSRS
ncbi:Zinc finger CCCH domain-containing protein [Arachis hypogaea]|nr:Zinc finger CCCH domain-containing protein [Arachis hypogaea]